MTKAEFKELKKGDRVRMLSAFGHRMGTVVDGKIMNNKILVQPDNYPRPTWKGWIVLNLVKSWEV
jgi:hypothetical protein